jgi:hypothetical protein
LTSPTRSKNAQKNSPKLFSWHAPSVERISKTKTCAFGVTVARSQKRQQLMWATEHGQSQPETADESLWQAALSQWLGSI